VAADADPTDWSHFFGLVFGSFSVAVFILLLFATSRWHNWRFGLMPSSKDREFKRHPLSFLKNTLPWCVHNRIDNRAASV
jgi:hypothetical protein